MDIAVLSDIHSNYIDRAIQLCKEDSGIVLWPHIAEKYWEKAIAEQEISLIQR
ncbi:MAG: hypothetical protein K0R05_1397 [Anaerocolumna sp.]|jgi:hypothetical protein|nr:hypothetical protein [Anaerocolumna sp.]